MSLCNNCMNYPCTDGTSVMLKSCPAYNPKPKPQTNADRIRTMTDEELAESRMLCPYTDVEANVCAKWFTADGARDCASCALDWLRQESEA